MSPDRVPLVVVSGYLGAGKTTLINRLLTEEHGLRLMVLVNDFGAINIDAELIEAAGGDTIALTNGCVCCTMGADLFMALGAALDRRPRPDALVVEASGIADPARIAEAAKAEPDLSYCGIVTMVDGDTFAGLATDERIGPQVRQQVARADLVVVRGAAAARPDPHDLIGTLTQAAAVPADTDAPFAPLLFGLDVRPVAAGVEAGHPDYVAWHSSRIRLDDRHALEACLAGRPAGLFRVKGTVRTEDGAAWEVQVVGRSVVLKRARKTAPTRLVGLGPASGLGPAEIEDWWARHASRAPGSVDG